MKTTKIIQSLLIMIFFISTTVIANEKARCGCCHPTADDAAHFCCRSTKCQSYTANLGITNQWLEQKSKEFLILDENKRAIFILESVAARLANPISNLYGKIDLAKGEYGCHLIAAMVFKLANIITVEQFEEYILRNWLWLKQNKTQLYCLNSLYRFCESNKEARKNAKNWAKLESEIYNKLKELNQYEIRFKDIDQSEIDLGESTFKEMVSFYHEWLPNEYIEFADDRNIEIERLVRFELFLTKKSKILLQEKSEKNLLEEAIDVISQKDSHINSRFYRPMMHTGLHRFMKLILLIRTRNTFSAKEEYALLHNAWFYGQMNRKLKLYYGKIGWANKIKIRFKKHYELLRELTKLTNYSLFSAYKKRVDIFRFHSVTKHAKDFVKRKEAEMLYKYFLLDIVKETYYSYRYEQFNGQERNLVNTLLILEKQMELFFQDKTSLFSKDGDLPQGIVSQIDTAFNDIKNDLPPPLMSKDCYGDRHAIYVIMRLMFKDDEELTEQERNIVIENMRLLFRLETILQYKKPGNYNDYIQTKQEIFPNLFYFMEQIKQRLNLD